MQISVVQMIGKLGLAAPEFAKRIRTSEPLYVSLHPTAKEAASPATARV